MVGRSELGRGLGESLPRRTFMRDRWTRAGRLALATVAVFVGVSIFPDMMRDSPLYGMLLIVGVFGLPILFALWAFISVTVDDRGVRTHAFGLTLKRLAWSDITRVRLEAGARGTRVLAVYAGDVERMRLLSDIDGFEVLRVIFSQQSKGRGFGLYHHDTVVDQL